MWFPSRDSERVILALTLGLRIVKLLVLMIEQATRNVILPWREDQTWPRILEGPVLSYQKKFGAFHLTWRLEVPICTLKVTTCWTNLLFLPASARSQFSKQTSQNMFMSQHFRRRSLSRAKLKSWEGGFELYSWLSIYLESCALEKYYWFVILDCHQWHLQALKGYRKIIGLLAVSSLVIFLTWARIVYVLFIRDKMRRAG